MSPRALSPWPGAPALRALLALLALLALAALAPATATASEGAPGAQWQFAPVNPPPPAPGTPEPPTTYPVPLGQIGDIEFWAPNRGLLITGGTGSSCAASSGASVQCGLYAYDGSGWHVLSTVCGGANGRIAWAGPEEFWTISDQRPGQVVVTGAEYGRVSLCHFQNGKVVGSYAMPLNQPNSYLPLNAAACLNLSNCWFGGELGQAPNFGAFHLHWDGHAVTVLYSPEDHAVSAMALAGPGVLFESVSLKVEEGEEIHYGSEDPNHPALLHQLDPPGSSVDFHNLLMPNSACAVSEFCAPLPNYGTNLGGLPVEPTTLGPFALGSDYTPSGSNPAPPQLWAIAGPNGSEAVTSGGGVAHTIALRYAEDPTTHERLWTQILGSEEFGGNDPFNPADEVAQGIAPEPGVAAAWISLHGTSGQAQVARVSATGKISERDTLGVAQGVGRRGNAGPIACPATGDCWLATSSGWLFHYADPAAAPLPQDSDPNFTHVITFRPTDDGVLQLPADEPPPDNSLANQAPPPPAPPPPPPPPAQVLSNAPVLLGLHTHVHGNTLELTFKLVAEAHVQLLAKRHGHIVAKTPRETLKAGKRKLLLRLNIHRWPTKLDLQATPLHPLLVSSPSAGGGGAVPGPSSAENVST
ncbi:MAG TPA: hypothetical protein VGY76_09490 [Solirubrobacteraceae bacterium]|jgi:hypothetical protein|nr:hypothetical protein [Solirubrobacteraceae bacterium]